MTSRTRSIRLFFVVGVVASTIPLATAAPAEGDAAPVYGGFATTAWAAPVRVEVYEPSIPMPANPQAEFEIGYSKVKAASDQSNGRASWFWPGDPVGEGFGTFAEVLGLPSDNPLTGNGYPVQVNSQYPGDRRSQADEPAPGMVMRTTAGDRTALAQVGFSPDGTVLGRDAEDDAPDGGGDGGDSTPPGGLQDAVEDLLSGGAPGVPSSSKTGPASATDPTAGSGTPGLPPQLAALVDMDGFVSVSRMSATKSPVVGASRTTLGEIRLLAGTITIGGLESVAKATSDGDEGTATGRTSWGTMAIAGQEFGIGRDGIVAQGATTPIPGLSDDPAKALDQLGVTIEVPKQVRTVDGDTATSLAQGLRVTIDTAVLAPVLSALPASQLGALIPAEAGPLKGIVSGLSTLAPKVVITLGIASSTVDTVRPIDLPDLPTIGDPGAGDAPAAGGTAGGTTSGSVPGAPAAGGAPVGDVGGAGQTPVGDLTDAAPTSAGLPELFSIPGMILIGAFVGAVAAGSWFRRLGAAALGGGASCPHGLDSGLPDLRKA
jgi:hypothetical protein